MKFSSETRYDLIVYAFKSIQLHYIMDKKNTNLNDLLVKNIVTDAMYHLSNQIEEYNKILNNELNHILNFVVSNMKIEDDYYRDKIYEILDMMSHYNIGKTSVIDNIIIDSNNDYQLIENCRLYLELYNARQNRNGQHEDNEIAADKFIFEKVIKQVSIDLYGKHNVKQKIKGINDIGQSLIADTIISKGKWYLLLDAKFYSTDIIHTNKTGKKTYYYQNNRFQMCSYMTEIRDIHEIRDSNVRGLIVHALDNEKFTMCKELNNHSMDIGHNMINLVVINIDCSAIEIIEQIKNSLLLYLNI